MQQCASQRVCNHKTQNQRCKQRPPHSCAEMRTRIQADTHTHTHTHTKTRKVPTKQQHHKRKRSKPNTQTMTTRVHPEDAAAGRARLMIFCREPLQEHSQSLDKNLHASTQAQDQCDSKLESCKERISPPPREESPAEPLLARGGGAEHKILRRITLIALKLNLEDIGDVISRETVPLQTTAFHKQGERFGNTNSIKKLDQASCSQPTLNKKLCTKNHC